MSLYHADRCAHCGSVISHARHPLTRRQFEIVQFLRSYIAAQVVAPSYEEIAGQFGYRSLATVHEHLINLERKGWIYRRYNEARSISLVELTPSPAGAPS